jgi:hypothetical protein
MRPSHPWHLSRSQHKGTQGRDVLSVTVEANGQRHAADSRTSTEADARQDTERVTARRHDRPCGGCGVVQSVGIIASLQHLHRIGFVKCEEHRKRGGFRGNVAAATTKTWNADLLKTVLVYVPVVGLLTRLGGDATPDRDHRLACQHGVPPWFGYSAHCISDRGAKQCPKSMSMPSKAERRTRSAR